MNYLRRKFDKLYGQYKEVIFENTINDPEEAHEFFIKNSQILNNLSFGKFILNNSLNSKEIPFELSNAAGFNKNGEIPENFLKYMGFNRSVVGTVTNEPYKGNGRPRMIRYPESESLVNWMGLPGVGSKKIAKNLDEFGSSYVPTTINLMATPGKQGEELLRDLEGTVKDTIKYADRFELNISCPNTEFSKSVKDARKEYQEQLSNMLDLLSNIKKDRSIYLKVSPDLGKKEIDEILDVVGDYSVDGITCGNTTTYHDPAYIKQGPDVGGASGKAVQSLSKNLQEQFHEKIKARSSGLEIIACGGIDSPQEVKNRLEKGASGIQIYTPLIFKGPKLLKDIRKNYASD